MDSNDDSLLDKSEDSSSEQETDDASSDSSFQRKPSNKILILSAESLSSLERKTFELPSELDLGSYNLISKSDLNISASNAGKGNPVVVKAQPILSSRHILLPETFPTNEEQNGLQIQNAFNSCEKKHSFKKRERERNVTNVEKSTLIKICENYPELNETVCNNETNNRKRRAWEKIQKEFIATCPDPESKDRSIKFLQGCFSRFRKERRKARRAHNGGEEEEFPNKHSTSSLSETGSPLNIDSMNEKPSVSGETTTSHPLLTSNSPSNGDLLGNGTNSCTLLPSSDSNVMLSTGDSLGNGEKSTTINPIFESDSNGLLCNGDSAGRGTLKASISDTNAESLQLLNQPTRLCLSSAFETKPVSMRSLRRKALELAVEVEKEKLSAFRYRREAEQERLAAMKLHKSAQRYAEMVEKERYETELLKKEAARLLLEKERLS